MKSIGDLFEDGRRVLVDGFAHLCIASFPLGVSFAFFFLFGFGANIGFTALLENNTQGSPGEIAFLIAFGVLYIVSIIGLIVGQYISFGAMIEVLNDAYHKKLRASHTSYLKTGSKFASKLFFQEIVKGLIVVAAMAVLVLPGVGVLFVHQPTGIFLMIFGVMLMVAFVLLFQQFVLFSNDILVSEKRGIWDSIKESYKTVKANFWGILGRYLIVTMPLGFVFYFVMVFAFIIPSLLVAASVIFTFAIKAFTFVLFKHAREDYQLQKNN